MQESGLKSELKRTIGQSLGDAAGDVCMRTQCQDIVPKALAGACRKEGRGQAARALCRPLLRACQEDSEARADCATRCARYFNGDEVRVCERDCNLARCRVHEPYDGCVASKTMADVLACFERTEWRGKAEKCLRDRCGVEIMDGRKLDRRVEE